MEMWPTLAPEVPYRHGSSFFHAQERAFFSHDNSIRVQIEIDAPYTNQALGGYFGQEKGKARADPLQLSAISCQQPPSPAQQQPPPSSSSSWNVSPPSQHQSPSEHRRTQVLSQPTKPHRLQTIPINPLPVAAGPTNNHHMGQYPYPPPELRHKSPMIIDDDAWRRPTPYSERRRAGKAIDMDIHLLHSVMSLFLSFSRSHPV